MPAREAVSGVASLNMLATEFTAKAAGSARNAQRLGRHFGERLVRRIQHHATRRPGPTVQSGEYLDTITFDMDYRAGVASVVAGSDAPQTLRLEMGYVGTDALGRVYNQPPYAHYRPASDEMAAEYEQEMARLGDLDDPGTAG